MVLGIHRRWWPKEALKGSILSPSQSLCLGGLSLKVKDGGGSWLLPSTQAGLALVVPAICPFLQAHLAVCRAMVRRGWLLSRSRVTISQVPAANWPKDRKSERKCKREITIVSEVYSTWWNYHFKKNSSSVETFKWKVALNRYKATTLTNQSFTTNQPFTTN